MPRITDYLGPGPEPGRLEVRRLDSQRTEVFYVPSAEAVDAMQGAQIPNNVKLLDIDRANRRLTIHPVNTRRKIETFLKPKYPQIRRLTLTGQYFLDLPYITDESLPGEDGFPSNQTEVMMLLEDLPSSFIKDYEYGLGFSGDFKLLPPLVTELTEASEILISDEHVTGMIPESDTFAISTQDFEQIRKLVQTTARNGQDAMRTVKNTRVHNVLAPKLGLPTKDMTYGLSTARRIITRVANDEEPELSESAQSVLIDVFAKHSRSMADDQPGKLARLQRGVAEVTLDALITRFEEMLGRSHAESIWHDFLNENRILLSVIFSYPTIIVDKEVSVGGHRFSGSGGKLTDFMLENQITGNIAVIEIKKPNTPLLYSSHYRQGVFSASRELSGAINQVIDQRYQLMTEFPVLAHNSRNYTSKSYAVGCCLIIGKIPENEDMRKSFEFIRRNSREVEIITFDEMLMKLKNIKSFLSGEDVEDGEDAENSQDVENGAVMELDESPF